VHAVPPLVLASIALQPDAGAVLLAAVDLARRMSLADSSFVAVADRDGRFPIDARVGLHEPNWSQVTIHPGRGIGGQVLADRVPRTSDNYLEDPSITGEYVPIMRREDLRGLAVVPVDDLCAEARCMTPAALVYVSTHRMGAPGDRVVDELQRIAEMAAVGLAHVRQRSRPGPLDRCGLTSRELEVLELLDDGYSNRLIADQLVLAEATVKGHVRAILRKLDAASRLAAVASARRRGLLP
jgi:DNA-binding CsgD family transcriptional regulator